MASWAATPIRRRTSAGCDTTSTPATRAVPESGRARVVRIRTAVVLPAPFGPRSPSTVPAGTAKSTPPSASVSPYLLTRPSASIIVSGIAHHLSAKYPLTCRMVS